VQNIWREAINQIFELAGRNCDRKSDWEDAVKWQSWDALDACTVVFAGPAI